MSRNFYVLSVFNEKTNVGRRFRKQVDLPNPVGTQVHLACGDASGNLGNLDLVVKVSGRKDVVQRGQQAPIEGDSYDSLGLLGGHSLKLADVARFASFLKQDGWQSF